MIHLPPHSHTSLLRRIPSPLLALFLALIVYGLAAGPMLFRQSIAPHYVYLAEAFLHGRLDVVNPPTSYDMLVVDGRNYVAQSPMPAILLMPVVAVFGKGFSDVLFSVVVGALNVGLVQSLFRRWWLTLLFAFGTPHLYLAVLGSTWFTAHVVAIFFSLLAVQTILTSGAQSNQLSNQPTDLSVRSVSPWFLSGLWLACAAFSRPSIFFASAFFLAWIVFTTKTLRHKENSDITSCLRAFVVRTLPFASAVALAIAAHGVYNAARFGKPTDFGYQHDIGAPNITSTYLRYGGFNLRFLPCNLFVSILNPPEVNGFVPPVVYDVCGYLLEGVNLSDASAPITPNPLGMSLFLTTPAFVLLVAARRREPIAIAAWIGLLAIMLPLWMYHNTGSLQFGYRYWMDAAPMWLILLEGPLRSLPRSSRALIAASIAINVWGYAWMWEKFVSG